MLYRTTLNDLERLFDPALVLGAKVAMSERHAPNDPSEAAAASDVDAHALVSTSWLHANRAPSFLDSPDLFASHAV